MYQLLNELGLVENDFQVYRHALILHQYSTSAKVNGYDEMFKPISGLFEYMYLKNGQT